MIIADDKCFFAFMCVRVCDELEGSEAWSLLGKSLSDQIQRISCQCFSFYITQEQILLTGNCAHEPSPELCIFLC